MITPPIKIDEALVRKIVRTAQLSYFGLGAEVKPDLEKYSGDRDFDTLAMLLVSSWHDKYDLISIFAAALKVVSEQSAKKGSNE